MTRTLSLTVASSLLAAFALLAVLPLFASADSTSKHPSVDRPSVTINAEGKALIRGAKVSSLSGSTVNASLALGTSTLSFTVNTDGNTKFYNRLGKAGALSDIAVGDTITFGGSLEGTGLTVRAVAVKDFTGAVTNVTLSGKVDAINLSGLSFTMDKSKSGNGMDGKITVQTNASTTITMNGAALPFASILAGDKAKATGNLNADGTVLSATTLEIVRPTTSNNANFNGFLNSWFKGDKRKGSDHPEDD